MNCALTGFVARKRRPRTRFTCISGPHAVGPDANCALTRFVARPRRPRTRLTRISAPAAVPRRRSGRELRPDEVRGTTPATTNGVSLHFGSRGRPAPLPLRKPRRPPPITEPRSRLGSCSARPTSPRPLIRMPFFAETEAGRGRAGSPGPARAASCVLSRRPAQSQSGVIVRGGAWPGVRAAGHAAALAEPSARFCTLVCVEWPQMHSIRNRVRGFARPTSSSPLFSMAPRLESGVLRASPPTRNALTRQNAKGPEPKQRTRRTTAWETADSTRSRTQNSGLGEPEAAEQLPSPLGAPRGPPRRPIRTPDC
jgi:hypothetical protein